MTLTKVSPGQPLRITAESFNAFIDAANAHQAGQLGVGAEGTATGRTAGIVTVRNDSGADQGRFAVLGISDPLILPTENPTAFQERVALAVVAPDEAAHADRFCILQEPVTAGALGRGLILGVSPVRLEVTAEDDRAATLVTGQTGSLATGTEGAARILWKEAGTGQKWGIVQIPAGGSGGGGSPNLVLEVTAPAHSWLVGDVLRWNGTAWIFADAAVVGDLDVLAVVGRIPDEDTALLVLWGVFCLEGLTPHTDYWLDPIAPGALTATKPATNPRLVLHHAQAGLCILRSGGAGGGTAATRFADLTDVDVATTPPADGDAALWDETSQRWMPRPVIRAVPVAPHLVLAGPTAAPDAVPAFRALEHADLPQQPATSVLANATGAAATPAPLAAGSDNTVLLRVSATLQWGQLPGAALADGAVGTAKLADGAVTDAKLVTVAWTRLTGVPAFASRWPDWSEVTGKPASFPASYHVHLLGGDLTGSTDNAHLADGSVTDAKVVSVSWGKISGVPTAFPPATHDHSLGGDLSGSLAAAQIAAGAVGTAEIADGTVTNAKLQKDFLRIGTTDWHLGDTVTGLMTNPMTGVGDLIVGGTAGAPQRLPANQGGTLQILTSKNNVTSLISHILNQMEDVEVASPTEGQVLTYEAATSQWKNKAPAGGAGHGQHPAMVGKITSKSSGNIYNITLYPEYPSLAVAWVTSATQLQADTARTIPANTWTIACGVLKAGQAGTSVAHYDFFIQVPVWM
jgi:hypothetical protein